MSRAKKVFFPKIRLQEMLNRPGGIAREQALEMAMTNLREISGESDAIIEAAIAAIEAIANQAKANRLAPEQMREILEQADQVVTLAGTFGYTALDRAARALCDICDGLLRAGLPDAAPIHVHVRALRMFAPSGVQLGKEAAAQVLSELEKIMVFYDFQPIA
jgi:hypothetical protein